MTTFTPRNKGYKDKVRTSFLRQATTRSLELEILDINPGEITISMPFNASFTQPHGFMHGGIISTALDCACGFASYSLVNSEDEIVTAEMKTCFIAPASGRSFIFEGKVIKPGKTLFYVQAEAFSLNDQAEKTLVATMSATMFRAVNRDEIQLTP